MNESELPQYLAVLVLLGLAIVAPFGMILFSMLLGQRGSRSKIKDTAYECGMLPVGPGNARFSVKFYLVAMLFILFDIEVVFMYPWAVVYKAMLADPATLDERAVVAGPALLSMAVRFGEIRLIDNEPLP